MSTQDSNIAPHEEEFDAVALWQLNATPRYPLTPADWQSGISLPKPCSTGLVGNLRFEQVIDWKTRFPVAPIVADLFASFRCAFEEASTALNSNEWRLLYYLERYPLALLADPAFVPGDYFERIFAQDPSQNEVPGEWIGITGPVTDTLGRLEVRLRCLDVDSGKAIYAILSLAKSLGMKGQHEVLQVPWWRTWWLESYLAAMDRASRNLAELPQPTGEELM